MKQTQKQRILDYLAKYRYITTLDAVTKCGVLCLWKRIAELEKEGHVFKRDNHEPVTNRDGSTAYITEYWYGGRRAGSDD